MRQELWELATDFHYENSGATGEENLQAEDCEWVYSNCTCGKAEELAIRYDYEDDGDY